MSLLLALLLCAAPTAAADCRESPCLEAAARDRLASGQPREAIALLKPERARLAESRPLSLLLARAYLADGNEFWALRTLASFESAHPGDCETLSWIAMTQLRQGALDRARESLDAARCPASGPLRARHSLVEALLATTAGAQPELARRPYAVALSQPVLYAEDLGLAEHLAARVEPGYTPPLSGRLEAQAGWAGNPLASSPTDASSEGESLGSPVAQLGAQLRLGLPRAGPARPFVEGEARGLGYSEQIASDLSYLQLSARPGLSFDSGRASLSYRFESLLLAGGDRYEPGPLWFSHAHRIEAELGFGSLMAFGGFGRRSFREAGRTRLEADLGLGGNLRLAKAVGLTGALSGRRHSADRLVYDLWGGSLLLSLDWKTPLGLGLRAGLLASGDAYPESAGYFDPDEARRELLLRGSFSAWVPIEKMRLGATYELSKRVGTAERYELEDHRVLLKLSGSFDLDPRLPRPADDPTHVELDYRLDANEAMQETVRELLRQDEAMQRGSSCIER